MLVENSDATDGFGACRVRRREFLALALLGSAIGLPLRALAQAYPSRPIKLVVPFPPGGPTDVMARLVADRLSSALGQPAVIENRPGGAGGTVGAKSVASSDPDGYTLLVAFVGTLTIAPAIYADSGYNPIRSFAPVALLATGPQILVVKPEFPAKSLQELVAYAKANPKAINFASPGQGTQPHLLGEIFKSATGAEITHIPYRGSAPAITDLLAGQVHMMFDTSAVLLPHIQSGKVKALAVTTAKRDPTHPDVPTVIEGGVPQLEATIWASVVAPAGTPAGVVEQLNRTIKEGLGSGEMRDRFGRLGLQPAPMSPQDFSAFIAAETKKWAAVVASAGIK